LFTSLFSLFERPYWLFQQVIAAFSPLSRRYAPEQGTGPDTVNRTIKLRLLAQPTVPVSTAIREKTN
jgi:hypothetical protein